MLQVVLASHPIISSGYTVEFATRLASTTYQDTVRSLDLGQTELQELEVLHRNVVCSVGQLQEEHQRLAMRVSSCVAGTLISLRCLPEKLNPVIRPLMDCLKTEADSVMQVYMYVTCQPHACSMLELSIISTCLHHYYNTVLQYCTCTMYMYIQYCTCIMYMYMYIQYCSHTIFHMYI